MSEMIFCSDPEPRHRRWFNCIRMPFEFKYMLSSEVEICSSRLGLGQGLGKVFAASCGCKVIVL